MNSSKNLKRSFASTLFALLIALLAMVTATFAWYIYNTNARTTKVHMAAGSGVALKISNVYEDGYSYSTVMESMTGRLNPVSTDKISGGFQKVIGFTNGDENRPKILANLFEKSDSSDYYETSVFLKTNGKKMNVYLAKIGYEDDDDQNPISTAIRVGIVAHAPGKDQEPIGEYIFEINQEHNEDPSAGYNTYYGEEGHVLDSSKTDGSTVPFKPYNASNFCKYDSKEGTVSITDNSIPICSVEGDGEGNDGEAVELKIYIWLEGCDEDCVSNLCDKTLKNLALSFAGYRDS